MVGFFDTAIIVRGLPVKLDDFLASDVTGVLDLDVHGDDLLLTSENSVLGWININDFLAEGGVAKTITEWVDDAFFAVIPFIGFRLAF